MYTRHGLLSSLLVTGHQAFRATSDKAVPFISYAISRTIEYRFVLTYALGLVELVLD